MSKPVVVDLFCGLGGWTRGFLAEGWDAIGFDIERHEYGVPDVESDGNGGHKGTKPVEGRGWTQGCAVSLGLEGATAKPRTMLKRYPAQLVLQDVLTLDGRQFRGHAQMIVASPPCQRYSYMAMPWSRAKREILWQEWLRDSPFSPGFDLNDLFDACFRIAREAELPLVVENVKGAQRWVGRAQANYGSFYLWGDIANVGGRIVRPDALQFGVPTLKAATRKFNPDGTAHGTGSWFAVADSKNCGASLKVPGMNFHEYEKTGQAGRSFQSAAVAHTKNNGGSWFNVAHNAESGTGQNPVTATQRLAALMAQRTEESGMKGIGGGWFEKPYRERGDITGQFNSKSSARKAASAMIAEIPFDLAQWIARCFKP